MSDYLEQCPFCGSAASVHMQDGWYFVECDNRECQACSGYDLGESGAIERWNQRAELEAVKAERDALKAERAELYNAIHDLDNGRMETRRIVEDMTAQLLGVTGNAYKAPPKEQDNQEGQ